MLGGTVDSRPLIRVVNAFRSNLDARNNPAYQTALLRKASAASPSGTGFVRSQLHSQPHTSAAAGLSSPKEETAAASSVAAPSAAAPASSPPGREPQQASSPPGGPKEGDATSNHSVETAV
ncbi:hypothetical protein HPB51_025082 [Rhipicephalus microplus]|uniref:Uncharacterized protein n=1 Tax=Rhipicephalus microplus TaxID=6941 RepID=A0A9J6DK70_RHIMP|nr:hypothetical protein HPB51_025082 [Rhipicephalus microplus]